MATTKTTRRPALSRTTTPRQAKTTANPSLPTRAGNSIKARPVATAAIATGLVSAIAAAVAGFFAFKKSGKTFSEFSGDIATSVMETAGETGERVKDGLTDAGTKAKAKVAKIRDGLEGDKTQAQITEEALTVNETGVPTDPLIEQQSKVGAVSY